MNDDKTITKRGKTNGYKSNILWAKRDRKRLDALARNGVYDSLTTKEKITLAKSRPGENKRELARLEVQLAREKTPLPPKPTKEEKDVARKVKMVKYGKDLAKSNLVK